MKKEVKYQLVERCKKLELQKLELQKKLSEVSESARIERELSTINAVILEFETLIKCG